MLLWTLSIYDGRTMLIIFYLGNPHFMKTPQTSQDTSPQPGTNRSFRDSRSQDFDSPTWSRCMNNCFYFIPNPIGHGIPKISRGGRCYGSGKTCSTPTQDRIAEQLCLLIPITPKGRITHHGRNRRTGQFSNGRRQMW